MKRIFKYLDKLIDHVFYRASDNEIYIVGIGDCNLVSLLRSIGPDTIYLGRLK